MPTPQQSTPSSTRTRLINAALHTLETHGIAGLTLDAVANEAGVSKGGLLHHFRSKEALIEGVLRHLFAAFDVRVQHYLDQEPPLPGRWLRAYVRATFDEDPIPLELAAMLFVAVIENDRLLGLIREDAQRWQERLSDDGVPVARAMVIRQAADAVWTERMIDAAPAGETTRVQVFNELITLTHISNT